MRSVDGRNFSNSFMLLNTHESTGWLKSLVNHREVLWHFTCTSIWKLWCSHEAGEIRTGRLIYGQYFLHHRRRSRRVVYSRISGSALVHESANRREKTQ